MMEGGVGGVKLESAEECFIANYGKGKLKQVVEAIDAIFL